jgi:5-(carboxyamino)imidazole ribonucleotide mutase
MTAPPNPPSTPAVAAVVMGSDSDLGVMQGAVDALAEFDLRAEVRILSAHRTPWKMLEWARGAAERGIQVIVAGAGGAAHLPGMIAAATPLPVIGVPIVATPLAGLDALLSIAQMPAGVPVATVAIGAGRNAGLLAVRILAAGDPSLRAAMEQFQADLATLVDGKDAALATRFGTTPGDAARPASPRTPDSPRPPPPSRGPAIRVDGAGSSDVIP